MAISNFAAFSKITNKARYSLVSVLSLVSQSDFSTGSLLFTSDVFSFSYLLVSLSKMVDEPVFCLLGLKKCLNEVYGIVYYVF